VVSLALYLVDDVPKVIFLEQLFLQKLQDRQYYLVKEYPSMLKEVAVEGTHVL